MDFVISEKMFFESLGYNVAQSVLWGNDSPNMDKSLISSTREAFRNQAFGIVDLANGTHYRPIGTRLFKFHGIPMPQDFIDSLRTNEYWPKWITKDDLTLLSKGE